MTVNDCVHFDIPNDICGIYCVPRESISSEIMGCYMSIAERDLMLLGELSK